MNPLSTKRDESGLQARDATLPDYRDFCYERYATMQQPQWYGADRAKRDQWAVSAIARVASWLPPDRKACCLDVGCGSGNVLWALRKLGYSKISGVDRCAQWRPALLREFSDITTGDASEYLQQRRMCYDLITAFDVLEHLHKNEVLSLLSAILGALKPGGSAIFQLPNASSPFLPAVRYGDFTHELAFEPASFESLLRAVGFTDCESRPCSPTVHGLRSAARRVGWGLLWTVLAGWNLIETGAIGHGVFTRVFISKARRPVHGDV